MTPLPYVVIATTPDRRARLDKCIAALRASTLPHVLVVYENQDGGCGLALRKALLGIVGEIFLLNDDMIVEPDCLERLQAAYRESFPNHDGVVQPDDNYHGGELGVSPYGSSLLLMEVLGHGYKHYFWDTELTTVLKARGKYRIVKEARLDHQHVTKGAPDDETYRKTSLNFEHDHALYNQREAAGFPTI